MRLVLRSLSASRLTLSAPNPAHLNRHLHNAVRLRKIHTPCIRCQFRSPQGSLLRKFSSESSGKKPSSDAESIAPDTSTSDFKNLPSQKENRRSDVSKRFSHAMDELQTALFSAGKKLNEVTGYSDIETLKKAIEEQEEKVRAARQEARKAKEEYQNAINRRSASQREVNELLQRKHAWSPTDLERFTELYRSDHANEQEESLAEERLARAEKAAEEAHTNLNRSILARYHEEQIWSDKIRRASTWGTWGLMGFNVLLFIIVQLGLEPWRRRRLVRGFEEKVREVIEEENMRSALLRIDPKEKEVVDAIEKFTDAALAREDVEAATQTEGVPEVVHDTEEGAPTSAVVHDTEEDTPTLAVVSTEGEDPTSATETDNTTKEPEEEGFTERIRGVVRDLTSEKEVMIKQVDLTTLALESAGVGAFLAVMVSLIISQR